MPSQANKKPNYIGLVPAGGAGQRFGGPVPKQYASLGAARVIEHSVQALLADVRVARVYVVVSENDELAEVLFEGNPQVKILKLAGKERVNTVLNALNHLIENMLINDTDWVLVHDAARPGLALDDLARLIDVASEHVAGGLLAVPMPDTLKKAEVTEEGEVISRTTVPRDGIWAAQTPQMFRAQALSLALTECLYKGMAVTDEASAIEAMGISPLLIEGRLENMKITRPNDLSLVARMMCIGVTAPGARNE